jgi:hypothetical protein
MNEMCNGFLLLDSDDLRELPSATGSFVEVAGCVGRRVVNPGNPRPPRTRVPADPPPDGPPPGIRAPASEPQASEPQASAVKRGSDTAVSTVKAKKQCAARDKAEPAPLPVAALEDSSLQWDRLAAMAMFASKHTGENVVQLVQRNGGVGSPGARQALVTMLTRYIDDPNRAPLPSSGREPVPREIKSLDTAKHGRVKNPTLSSTETKWFYWEEGKGKKWFGEEPAGYRYKAAAPAAPAAPAAARPTLTATLAIAEPADTEPCDPPLPATLDIGQKSASFGPTPVQLRCAPKLNSWCGVIANYSRVYVVARGTEGGMSQGWVKIRWEGGIVPQEGWVKREYVTQDDDAPIGNPLE